MEMTTRKMQSGNSITKVDSTDPIPVVPVPSTLYGATAVAYRGTTESGSAAVGTLSFANPCHAFNFFNKTTSPAVELSFDGVAWLPLGASGNWPVDPPGGYYNASPFAEIYHRKNSVGTSDFAVVAWEV